MSPNYPWPENLLRRLALDGDCVVFTGALQPNGYGRVRQGERVVMAHRVMYELLVGPIPDGLEPDHLCRNRACVNVGHLELVTHRENTLRGVGVTARNARKTHCLRGHPFDEQNTLIRPSGRRSCRQCASERELRRVRRWTTTKEVSEC